MCRRGGCSLCTAVLSCNVPDVHSHNIYSHANHDLDLDLDGKVRTKFLRPRWESRLARLRRCPSESRGVRCSQQPVGMVPCDVQRMPNTNSANIN